MKSGCCTSTSAAGFICLGAAVIVYLNTLSCGFCYDDKAAILQNKDLLPGSSWSDLLWNDFWGTPLHLNASHKSYRPLCVATFRLNYLLAELEPMGYHLVNILLHGVVCYLYVHLVSLVCSQVWPALIAGLLFAVHPIHTEAVAGIVGRAELLAALFFIAALLTYHKAVLARGRSRVSVGWLLCSMTLTLCSLLSKETGLTVTVVCVVYDYCILHRGTLRSAVDLVRRLVTHRTAPQPVWVWSFLYRTAVLTVYTATLLAIRLWMSVTPPNFNSKDNEALDLETPYRQLHWAHMTFVNSELLLNPSRLIFDYRMGAIPLITSLLDHRNILTVLTLAAYAGLGLYSLNVLHWQISHNFTNQITTNGHINGHSNGLYKSNSATRNHYNEVAPYSTINPRAYKMMYSSQQVLLFGLTLIVVPFLPASNILFSVGFVVAERVLYLPSMGLCLLAGHGLWKLINKSSTSDLAKLFLAILLLTHTAKTMSRNKDWQSKITMYGSLLKLYPQNGYALANLAREYRNTGQYDKAEDAYRLGMAVAPNLSINFVNLGAMLKKQQRFSTAEPVLFAAVATVQRSLSAHPEERDKLASLYLSLSGVVGRVGSRLSEALELVEEGLKLNDSKSAAHNTRGTLLLRLGDYEGALGSYTRALVLEETNTNALYNLALVYKQRGEVTKSVHTLEALLRVDGSHELAKGALHELKLLTL